MKIERKSKEELARMRRAGQIVAEVLVVMRELARPGVSTAELNAAAEEIITRRQAIPAFKGYPHNGKNDFPASICTSVNEEIVHGIPSDRKLQEGDIISLDLGINFKGYFTDAAVTLPVGKISPALEKLIAVTKEALSAGIAKAIDTNHLYDISYSIQRYVEKNGFSVVREFVGHGIGVKLHEEPEIPNFGLPHQGPVLKSGMVFAIEPMVNMGRWESEILDNGWTAVTKDRLPSAHFEHTVIITDKEPEILTA